MVLVKGYSKKNVHFDLDHLEKCGLMHGIQNVAINKFRLKVFLDVGKFGSFFALFYGNF